MNNPELPSVTPELLRDVIRTGRIDGQEYRLLFRALAEITVRLHLFGDTLAPDDSRAFSQEPYRYD